MSIANWLGGLGLAQYATAFEEEAIDFETLAELDDDDLISLGLPLGHRKRILRAIASGAGAPQGRIADAERRRITVMFCDLSGSTSLSEQLDPEDLRDLLRDYQQACVAVVERLDGHVAKYIGDGMLVYFGYPRAHEDDAARAVSAALDIVVAVRRIETAEGATLDVHIGIHTGLVVAGEMGAGATREAQAIVGETPNIAARLEALAAPGEILISGATHNLVEELFVFDAQMPHALKGIKAPVDIHRVLARTPSRSRFDAVRRHGQLPLIGRDQEVELLNARWERACKGEGQVFLLCGEAGIGKSRIIQKFCETVNETEGRALLLQCSAHHVNSALYPFIDEIGDSAGFAVGDDVGTRCEKFGALIQGRMSEVGFRQLSNLLLLASSQDEEEDARTRKEQTFAAILERFEGLSTDAPLCILFEDAHWADPSSKEMLDRIIDCALSSRILVIITFRPEFHAPSVGRPHTTLLALNRLGREESHKIIAARTPEARRTANLAEMIVARADGVPLFLEELARTVLETGKARDASDIPTTLDALLMARLDQLGPAKEVAQAGSVIGREFSVDLLAEALNKPASALAGSLQQIVEADLAYPRGVAGPQLYVFKHALVQDAAYNSLLKSTRGRLHDRVASALLRKAATDPAPPETVAYHLNAAERLDEAAEMWLRAGREAQQRSADKEAIAHLQSGLEALLRLEASAERNERELVFQLALAPLLLATEGWGTPETAKSYARARELCVVAGEKRALPPVLYGEYLILVAKADFRSALSTAAELLALANELEDEAGRIQGHRVLGWCSLYLGAIDDAETHADGVLALYQPDRHATVALGYGYDPKVAGLSIRTIICSIRGDEAAASRASREAIQYARKLGLAGSLGYALMFSGALPAAMRDDCQTARDYASELASLAVDQSNPLWEAYAKVILGWATDSADGGGAEQIERGLAQLQKSAPNPWNPLFLALLAEARLQSADTAGALRSLDEAICAVEQTHERSWEARICHLKGLALMASSSGSAIEADEWISKAAAIARDQGASRLASRAEDDLRNLHSS